MSDYKRSPTPKVNFILKITMEKKKITMEYAASTPSSLCDTSMELYVYKMVKNNKANEKQSCRPSLLITVMLYFNPGVSANSNKNGSLTTKIIMPSFLLWIVLFVFKALLQSLEGGKASYDYLQFTEADRQVRALKDL